jgi:hypothetical protein
VEADVNVSGKTLYTTPTLPRGKFKTPVEPIRAAFTFVSAITATALSIDGHAPRLCG